MEDQACDPPLGHDLPDDPLGHGVYALHRERRHAGAPDRRIRIAPAPWVRDPVPAGHLSAPSKRRPADPRDPAGHLGPRGHGSGHISSSRRYRRTPPHGLGTGTAIPGFLLLRSPGRTVRRRRGAVRFRRIEGSASLHSPCHPSLGLGTRRAAGDGDGGLRVRSARGSRIRHRTPLRSRAEYRMAGDPHPDSSRAVARAGALSRRVRGPALSFSPRAHIWRSSGTAFVRRCPGARPPFADSRRPRRVQPRSLGAPSPRSSCPGGTPRSPEAPFG